MLWPRPSLMDGADGKQDERATSITVTMETRPGLGAGGRAPRRGSAPVREFISGTEEKDPGKVAKAFA